MNIYYILEFETSNTTLDKLEDKIWRLEEICNGSYDIFKAIFIFAKEIPTIEKPAWIDFTTFEEIKSEISSEKDKYTPIETAGEAFMRELKEPQT